MTFETVFGIVVVCWFVIFMTISYLEWDDEEPKRRGESDSTYRG